MDTENVVVIALAVIAWLLWPSPVPPVGNKVVRPGEGFLLQATAHKRFTP